MKNLKLVISEELLKDINDFRFKNRFNSRLEAIRFLLVWALKHYKKEGGYKK